MINWSATGYNFVRFVIPFFVAAIMFMLKTEKRDHFVLRLISGLIGFAGLGILVCGFSEYLKIGSWFYIHFFLVMVIGSVFIWFTNKISIKESLFFIVAAYNIQNLTDNFNCLIFFQAGKPSSMVFNWLIFLLPYLVTYPCYYFFFVRKINSKCSDIMDNWKFVAIFSIVVGLVYLLSMYATLISPLIFGTSDDNISLRMYAIIACGLSLLLQFNVFNNTSLEVEKKSLEQVIETENDNNLRNQKNYELLSMKIHDLRHQIRVLKTKTDSEEIKASLDSLEKDAHFFNTSVKTGNIALDSVLSNRSLYCSQNNITFSCMADGAKLSFISDGDILSLFGNAIDNAIDAVEQAPIEKRNITINVKSSNNFIIIRFDNYCETLVEFVDGLPQTTKDKKDLHGYVTKSIAFIVEKYKGKPVFNQKDNIFSVNIAIPIPE